VLPATYDDDTGKTFPLYDEMVLSLDGTGDACELTVIWPDPGTDTVTIEAGNRWRIEDITVTDQKNAG